MTGEQEPRHPREPRLDDGAGAAATGADGTSADRHEPPPNGGGDEQPAGRADDDPAGTEVANDEGAASSSPRGESTGSEEAHFAGGSAGAGQYGGDIEQERIDLSDIGAFLSASEEMKTVVAERDEYLDSLRRLQADFDNYRKRAIRQQTELVERANEGLLVRLLPVLDALDLAMAHLPSAGEAGGSDAMKSLVQIGTLLRDVLEREGLERIDQTGVPFDPTIHDAVAKAPREPSENDALHDGGDEAPGAEGNLAEGDGAGAGATGGEPAGGGGGRGAGGGASPEEVAARRTSLSPTSADNSVANVMRSGYRLKGRVLRPAMVAVRG